MRIRNLSLIILSLFWLGSSTTTRANPTGGNIIAGNASIQTKGNLTQINQSSDKTIINWQTFNINPNETTQFIQPQTSSIALNRVNTSYGASKIMGNLLANGNVWIINPAGILFGPNAQVNVGGLLVTTSNISNEDFINGNYRFNASSQSNGAIVNQGTIRIADGGIAALVAPGVENSGIIQANMGKVVLSSGNKFTLDFYGDQLIKFDVGDQVKTKAIDANGKILNDAVTNSGSIIADGGKVFISAQSAQNIVDNVINMKGYIQANTVNMKNGVIVLSGGTEGKVSVSGKLVAQSNNKGSTGGKIRIKGKHINLYNATVDASGYSGGGRIVIGGKPKSKHPSSNSNTIYISNDSQIIADALTEGKGGHIVTFAEDSNRVYGKLSARGGTTSGDGGLIETSTHHYFDIAYAPNVSAQNGKGGTWLIDPYDVTIVSGNDSSNITKNNASFTAVGDSATLGVDLITQALMNGNVFISTGTSGTQAGNISLNTPLIYSNTSANTLTLSAAGNIILNQSITPANNHAISNIELIADNENKFAGSIQLASAQRIDTNGGTLTLHGADIDLKGSISTISSNSSGAVNIFASDSIGMGIIESASMMYIDNSELSRIATGKLTIQSGENSEIEVGGITASNMSNIGEVVLNNLSSLDGISIQFHKADSDFNKLTVNAGYQILISSNVTSHGDMSFITTSPSSEKLNPFTIDNNATLSSTEGNITINTRDIDLTKGYIHASNNQNVTINALDSVGLGNKEGILSLTNSEISNISANNLYINSGSFASSDILIDGLNLATTTINNLYLNAMNHSDSNIRFINTESNVNSTLHAQANNDITIDAPLTVTGENLTLDAVNINQTENSSIVASHLTLANSTSTSLHDIAINSLSTTNISGDVTIFNNSPNLTITNLNHSGSGAINIGNTGSLTLLNSFNTGAANTNFDASNINLGATLTSQGGLFTFNSNIKLVADSNITTNGADIYFEHQINGHQNLTLNSGTGHDVTFGGTVGNSATLASLVIQNAHDVTNNAMIYTDNFLQIAGTGTTNLGLNGNTVNVNQSATITTYNLIGNLLTPKLSIKTNFLNITGAIDHFVDAVGAMKIKLLNKIGPGTHFFNGIDLYPYNAAHDASNYFIYNSQINAAKDLLANNYWYIEALKKCEVTWTPQSQTDCLYLAISEKLFEEQA